jgi:hypothetical protein
MKREILPDLNAEDKTLMEYIGPQFQMDKGAGRNPRKNSKGPQWD